MAYDKNRVEAIEAKLVGAQPKPKGKPRAPKKKASGAVLIPPAQVRAAKPRVVRY